MTETDRTDLHGTRGRIRRTAAAALLGTGVLASVAFAGWPSPAGADGTAGAVTLQTFQVQPARLDVAAGTTVTWTNNDDIEHMVTAGTPERRTGLFNQVLNGKGKTFSFTFSKAGGFAFFCDRHQFMRGEIVVK